MQQKVLDLAVEAGVELARPAEVIGVATGNPPTMSIRSEGVTRQIQRPLGGRGGRTTLKGPRVGGVSGQA